MKNNIFAKKKQKHIFVHKSLLSIYIIYNYIIYRSVSFVSYILEIISIFIFILHLKNYMYIREKKKT